MNVPVAAVLACAAALSFAGCLAQLQDTDPSADGVGGNPPCDLLGNPGQIPTDAPSEAGPGQRPVDVTVLGGDGQPAAHMAVVAYWQQTRESVHAVRLVSDAAGKATLRVPAGEDLELMAGRIEWTHEAHLDAGDRPASLILTPASVLGLVEANWTTPLAQGVSGAAWQPTDLPWADAGHMDRLERLRLVLAWTNGPQGGADFGIAVGPNGESGFHYTNSEYQATVGEQSEERILEPGDFADLGWGNTTRPQAGPSISTGGFAVDPIAYTLAWEATFEADPGLRDRCENVGDVDAVDVTASRGESGGSMTGAVTIGPSRTNRLD
ncbi:MAG: hypothetical protein ACYC2H_09710 [Thermoplasmatota archaeon]